MIIVSNTSPLTNLAAIGQFDLLRHLYGRLHVAQGVWEELNAKAKSWPGRDEVAEADWIERHTVHNQALVTALDVIWTEARGRRSPWPWSLMPILSSWMNGRDGTRPRDWNSVSPASLASCWRPSHGVLWMRFALIWTPCGTKRASI
jgi:hypothetical protein